MFIPMIKAVEDYYSEGHMDSLEYHTINRILERIEVDEEILSELKRQLKGIL